MTKTKWTPGPWRFYADTPSVDPNWHIVTTANRMRVLANIHIEPGKEVDQANAHLIAAAPELYEALVDVTTSLVAAMSLLERGGKKAAASDKMFEQMLVDYQGSVERSRAVLAKTRGEQ